MAKPFGDDERWCVAGPSLIQMSHGSVVEKKKNKGLNPRLMLKWEACTARVSHTAEASCNKTSSSSAVHMSRHIH